MFKDTLRPKTIIIIKDIVIELLGIVGVKDERVGLVAFLYFELDEPFLETLDDETGLFVGSKE